MNGPLQSDQASIDIICSASLKAVFFGRIDSLRLTFKVQPGYGGRRGGLRGANCPHAEQGSGWVEGGGVAEAH